MSARAQRGLHTGRRPHDVTDEARLSDLLTRDMSEDEDSTLIEGEACLTDRQRQTVLEYAGRVPEPYRVRFIENVVDRLFGTGAAPTDERIAEAVHHVASMLCVNIAPRADECEG